jgi:hypothetical protein
MFRLIVPFFLILAIAAVACEFSVDIPSAPTPGPEITEEIRVAIPTSDEVRLNLSFGAGKLVLSPGADKALVTGTATYNISDFEPEVNIANGNVEIRQGEYKFKSINLSEYKNEWDLALGETPLELIVTAGAYEGDYEFGGLSLKELTIRDGAANVALAFSEPNRNEMSVFRYETGASDVKLTGLANANFATMIFSGGAGNYLLDFSGKMQREATVTIESGLSDVHVVIPEMVNTKVTVEGAAVNVNYSSGWVQDNNIYLQTSDGPLLTIVIRMSAGNLTITD